MRAKVLYFLFAGVFSVLFASCLKDTDFPDEPIIEYKSLERIASDLVLNFKFTDGDGNFGLEQSDSLSPYDEAPYNHNLILTYYEKQDGVWKRFGNDFPLFSPFYSAALFNQTVPWVRPSGQNQTQQGTISYSLVDPYYNFNSSYDTCRFEFYIYDRDLNQSNSQTTDFFLKP